MATTTLTRALPYSTTAARDARHWVVQLLTEGCVLATIEAAVLLTSELVTNAVLHGEPPVRLHVQLDDGLVRVEVHDDASTSPIPREAQPSDISGRGLAIVDALASRWGIDHGSPGKAVWFELSTEPSG